MKLTVLVYFRKRVEMKRLKFKNRHKLKLSETIGLSETRIRDNLAFGIARAFPDKQEQREYILALYKGLDY